MTTAVAPARSGDRGIREDFRVHEQVDPSRFARLEGRVAEPTVLVAQ
jgi:hypothetical protein